MDCANQLRSSRTEYESDTNPNICQFVTICGIRGLCGIGVLGMNHLKYLVCLDAKILIFHRRSSGEKSLSRFHMSTDTSGPSPLPFVLSSKFHEKRS